MTEQSLYETIGAISSLTRKNPTYLPILKACLELGESEAEFAGSWVFERVGTWFPNLRPLTAAGLLIRVETSRRGQRAYYRLADPLALKEALAEIYSGQSSD